MSGSAPTYSSIITSAPTGLSLPTTNASPTNSTDSTSGASSWTAAIVIVTVLTVVVGGPVLCCTWAHCMIERRNKRQYFIDKASEPTLTYRIWKERREEAAERERARNELEDADREFLAFRAREEGAVGIKKLFLGKHAESNGGSVAMESMAVGVGGDGDGEVVGEGRAARPTALTKEFLALQAEMLNSGAAANGGTVVMGSMSAGRRGEDDEERLIEGQPRTVQAAKRRDYFKKLSSSLSTAQEAEARNGNVGMFFTVPEGATAGRIRDGDEEALVGGEPEVGGQMRVLSKRPTWGSEAPPAYSSLPPGDHEHGGDMYSDTG